MDSNLLRYVVFIPPLEGNSTRGSVSIDSSSWRDKILKTMSRCCRPISSLKAIEWQSHRRVRKCWVVRESSSPPGSSTHTDICGKARLDTLLLIRNLYFLISVVVFPVPRDRCGGRLLGLHAHQNKSPVEFSTPKFSRSIITALHPQPPSNGSSTTTTTTTPTKCVRGNLISSPSD